MIDNGIWAIATTDAAIHADAVAAMNAGVLNISKSNAGIEAAAIPITDGTINLVTSGDGFNATTGRRTEVNDGSSVVIKVGLVVVNSSKGDPLDSNGNVALSDGTAIAHGPRSQSEVAFDINGTFGISGGLFIAAGLSSNMMIEVASSRFTQYSVDVAFSGGLSAASLFHTQMPMATISSRLSPYGIAIIL